MTRFILTIIIALSVPGAVAAQGTVAQDVRLVPDAPLRVTAEGGVWVRTEARFVAVRGDTLVVARPGAAEAALPLASVQAVQVMARPSRRRAYALRGAVAGALAGFVVAGAVLGDGYDGDDPGFGVFLAAGAGAPVGALLGAGAGYAIGAPRWEEVRVWPQGVRVGMSLPTR
ncbi:MAG TPA: hypothetical protein VF710_19600 [Longimicrobium sp.]|jgi:hypothetical protein